MKLAAKLLTCLVMAIAFGVATNSSGLCVQAMATIAICDCGNPGCGGCERGKLLAALRARRSDDCGCQTATPAGPAAACDCQACAQSAPTYVPAPAVMVEQPYTIETFAPTAVNDCGGQCGGGCQSCRIRRPVRRPRQRRVSCPQCDCDRCELKVKEGKSKKTCFKVEQKEVCIPAVTLPWKKCCPKKTSKMRVVNVLKKHSYKCPSCEYSWSVVEPETAPAPTAATAVTEWAPVEHTPSTVEGQLQEPTAATSTDMSTSTDTTTPPAPISEQAAEPATTGLDVPQPPLESGESK